LGRKRLFEKRISADEMRKKTKEYQTLVLKDIFPEYKLKEYINKIKNLLQKNGESEEVGDEFTGNGNSWFYTNEEDLHYFLEEDNDTNKVIKDEDTVKIQNCLNLSNSERLRLKCEVEENQWMGQYWVQYNNTRAFQNSVNIQELNLILRRDLNTIRTIVKKIARTIQTGSRNRKLPNTIYKNTVIHAINITA